MKWLDAWRPPEWLCVKADPDALAELQDVMLARHGNLLRAWRHMDADDTNSVSWAEFVKECGKLGFKRNIGGAWRALDRDVSGNVSLQRFDPGSCGLLTSFKKWVDELFGSVEFAFRSMDVDGSGTLTMSELRRGCRRGCWDGDVETLFRMS